MRARTIALSLSLIACGCAGSGVQLSNEAVVLDVPCAPQQSETYACGLVSVESLCSYWGVQFTESARAEIARTAERERGLSGAQMRAALESLGFETFLFEGQLDHGATGLFHEVDLGRPALLLLTTKPDHGHYVLCVGYDEPGRTMCLLDPKLGRVLVPFEALEKAWLQREHFTLLALPRTPADPTERKVEAP